MKNIYYILILCCLCLFSCDSHPDTKSSLPFGVNLAGAEFFHKKMDGVVSLE